MSQVAFQGAVCYLDVAYYDIPSGQVKTVPLNATGQDRGGYRPANHAGGFIVPAGLDGFHTVQAVISYKAGVEPCDLDGIIWVNGAEVVPTMIRSIGRRSASAGADLPTITPPMLLAAGARVDLVAYQNSGVTFPVQSGSNGTIWGRTWMSIQRVGV